MPPSREPMWRRYLRFFGPNVRRDVDDELAFHFGERIEELTSQGLDRETARRQAIAEFGELRAVRAELRRIDGRVDRRRRGRAGVLTRIGGLWMDVGFAVRGLKANAGLALAAAGSLALAIAANVTMFAGADVFAFHPFSVPESRRLIRVAATMVARGWRSTRASPVDFFDWREQAKTAELAATTEAGFNWADGERAERLNGAAVSAGFLAVHGVPVLAGREFIRADETSGVPVAMIGERIWRDKYAGATDVVGRSMLLDGQPHTIVGIVPNKYVFPMTNGDVWIPLTRGAHTARGSRYVWVFGRLQSGVTPAAAEAELGAIGRRLEQSYPETNKGWGVRVEMAIRAVATEDARHAALALVVAVGLVLLIACANVANLLLARTTSRAREIAIRSAVGAGRGRIAQLLLVESAVLAAIGGALGLLASNVGIAWFRQIIGPDDFGELPPFVLSARVLWYGLAVTAAAAFAFGLFPALRQHGDLTGRLRDGGRSETGTRRRSRLRSVLVATEFALSMVLLTTAGLALKTGYRLARVSLGFEEGRGLTFATYLSTREYPDTASIVGFEERLTEQLLAIPGVDTVGYGSTLPLEGTSGVTYAVDGVPPPGPDNPQYAQLHVASPGYFPAFGIRRLRGRLFGPNDRVGAPRVALVNQRFVNRHWPAADPIGHRVHFRDQEWTVIGVVADVREWGVHNEPPPAIYVAAAQSAHPWPRYAVRSDRPLGQLGPAIRAAVAAVAPRQPIQGLQSLSIQSQRGHREPRVLAQLFTLLAAIAVTLAVMGIYSVTSYLVAQRTAEIGVRRALGAGTPQIVGVVLRTGARALVIGGLVGLPLALAAGRGFAAMLSLYRTSAFDPAVLAAVLAILVGAAGVALLAPTRRALRVDPLVALRRE